jgi:hypothetical protein
MQLKAIVVITKSHINSFTIKLLLHYTHKVEIGCTMDKHKLICTSLTYHHHGHPKQANLMMV